MKAIEPNLKAAGNDQQIAVLKLWKGTTKITFQRIPDGLDELTTIRGVPTTASTFVKSPVHFDRDLSGTGSSRSRKMKGFCKNIKRGKEQNGAKRAETETRRGKTKVQEGEFEKCTMVLEIEIVQEGVEEEQKEERGKGG